VGQDDYEEVALDECRRYISLIRKRHGEEPTGAKLTVSGEAHDYGTYFEVFVAFNPNVREAVEYAFRVENDLPLTWDDNGQAQI
jgi:hypothetical protein